MQYSDGAAIVGDITPKDGISKEKKMQLEADAIVQIQNMLGPASAAGNGNVMPLLSHAQPMLQICP